MAAIDDPTTRSALRRYRRSAIRAIGTGLVLVALGVENVARATRELPGEEWPLAEETDDKGGERWR
jgi:hypothetical protein